MTGLWKRVQLWKHMNYVYIYDVYMGDNACYIVHVHSKAHDRAGQNQDQWLLSCMA